MARKEPPGPSDWPSAGPSVVKCALTSPVVPHTSSLASPACPLLRRKNLTPEAEFRSYNIVVPCPNQIKVTDPLLERATDDIFRKTRDDNEPGLSREDRKFLEILDRGIHKNAKGNWEMPLPFRNERQTMPNNRDQAMQRLQGLLKTFARKPEMKADYLEFMAKNNRQRPRLSYPK